MIITNKQALLTALEVRKTITFGENGTLKTQSWLGQIFQWFYDRILPRAASELYKNQLHIAMARLINDEAVATQGPHNLENPLPIRVNDLSNVYHILESSIIEHAVNKTLPGMPKEIQLGAAKYLQGKRERDFPYGPHNPPPEPPNYPLLERYVQEEIEDLQSKDGELLSILACGYTCTAEELRPQIAFLEDSIQTAVQETWEPGHQDKFSPQGLYESFVLDARRDRPIVQGQRIDPSNTDADFAARRYGEILLSEIKEPSMAAVVGICMSQTAQAGLARLVMGEGCPVPLNPFVSPEVKLGEIITTVSSTDTSRTQPRVTMTHTKDEVTLDFHIDIALSDITQAPLLTQNVGTLLYSLVIPKYQFPLLLGMRPDIKITNMALVREKGFTGKNN